LVRADSLEPVFAELRERMLRASKGMNLAQDEPGNLVLKTTWNEPGKNDPAWSGAVQLKKNYVSSHLMPLHAALVARRRAACACQANVGEELLQI
jgi:hypothetical protein